MRKTCLASAGVAVSAWKRVVLVVLVFFGFGELRGSYEM